MKKARDAKKRYREERDEVISQTSDGITRVHKDITDIVGAIAEIKEKVSQLQSPSPNHNTYAADVDGPADPPVKKTKISVTQSPADTRYFSYWTKIGAYVVGSMSIILGFYSSINSFMVLSRTPGDGAPLPWSEHEFLTSRNDKVRANKKDDFTIL